MSSCFGELLFFYYVGTIINLICEEISSNNVISTFFIPVLSYNIEEDKNKHGGAA